MNDNETHWAGLYPRRERLRGKPFDDDWMFRGYLVVVFAAKLGLKWDLLPRFCH